MSPNIKSINSKTIGPLSAKLINELILRGKEIFTLSDACEVYGGSRQETSHFLLTLVNRRVLARLKSGLFLILKIGQENTQLSNWPIIANILAGPKYYISHYSAMRLHGMTTHPLKHVIITVIKKRVSKEIHNIIYQFIYSKPDHFWGSCEHWVSKHEKVIVSDIERTILDGLARPDLCGGIKEIVRGIWSKQNQINFQKLVQYSQKYHSMAAVKRLGFILETLNLGIDILPKLFDIITSKDYILLDPYGEKTGKYLSTWHIKININIAELKESVWG